MITKTHIKGWSLAIVGYILSPLSWWNDLIINLPLAYVVALPVGAISKKLFFPTLLIAYWLTNLLGFILMHHGLKTVFAQRQQKSLRQELLKIILISLGYTLLLVIAMKLGWLQFLPDYFKEMKS